MQMFWFRLLRFLRCHFPFLELIECTACICLRCSWHIMTCKKSCGFLLTSSSLRFRHIKYCLPSLHSCPFTMKQVLLELSSILLHQIISNSLPLSGSKMISLIGLWVDSVELSLDIYECTQGFKNEVDKCNNSCFKLINSAPKSLLILCIRTFQQKVDNHIVDYSARGHLNGREHFYISTTL